MRKSITVPTPDEYAAMGLKWIGHADDAIASPFFIHGLMGWAMSLLPDFVVASIIMNMHLAIRKKGKKKDEKEKAK